MNNGNPRPTCRKPPPPSQKRARQAHKQAATASLKSPQPCLEAERPAAVTSPLVPTTGPALTWCPGPQILPLPRTRGLQ